MNTSLVDHLQLSLTTGVGPTTMRRLLEHFGSAEQVLAASPQDLIAVDGVSIVLSRRLRSSSFRERAHEVLEACQQQGVEIVLPDDKAFPRLLNEIPNPPSLLFVRGQLTKADSLSIAIVGTDVYAMA